MTFTICHKYIQTQILYVPGILFQVFQVKHSNKYILQFTLKRNKVLHIKDYLFFSWGKTGSKSNGPTLINSFLFVIHDTD